MQSRSNYALRSPRASSVVAGGEISKAAHEHCQRLRLGLRVVMMQLAAMLLVLIEILTMVLQTALLFVLITAACNRRLCFIFRGRCFTVTFKGAIH